tara:strand:+ start:71 stop:490 length:420 start_codon:yes stop_codon:yes gene_type:complete
MLSVSIMAVPLAAGHGINDGTKKTQGGTRMDKRGRPMEWTDSQVSDAKYLMAHNFTASRVGEIFNTTKNAVLGVLYRDKVKNGYVPPPDSKYTVSKIRHRFKRDPGLGERECNICSKTFTKSGKFDLFCYECRRTGRVI